MKVPEEVRDLVPQAWCQENTARIVFDACVADVMLKLLTEWFAAHELVDLSVCGPQCPAYHEDEEYGGLCWALASIDEAPTGQPCPVLGARNGG